MKFKTVAIALTMLLGTTLSARSHAGIAIALSNGASPYLMAAGLILGGAGLATDIAGAVDATFDLGFCTSDGSNLCFRYGTIALVLGLVIAEDDQVPVKYAEMTTERAALLGLSDAQAKLFNENRGRIIGATQEVIAAHQAGGPKAAKAKAEAIRASYSPELREVLDTYGRYDLQPETL
jgi:hypothetical protein